MKNELIKAVTQISLSVLITILIILSFGDDWFVSSKTIQTNNQTVEVNTNENEKEVELVNINTASKEELKSLPYIGDEMATRIIENRPYTSKWDLLEVEGIGEKTMDEMFERIEV